MATRDGHDTDNESTARHGDGNRDAGKRPPGERLSDRQDKSSAQTEQAQGDRRGAHSGQPDNTRP